MPIRSSRKKIKEALPKCFLDYFLTGHAEIDEEDDASFDLFLMRGSKGEEDLRKIWDRHKELILTQWIKKHPGSRPFIWWELDSPRQPIGTHPGWYYDGKLPEPRQRIGGTGTPSHEVLAVHPEYYYGIPVDWVDQWQVDYYNGRACDKDGKPQERNHWYQYKEGDFKGVAIDPNDPPVYESEAAYLKRHNLFYPGEERRLSAEDFEPEIVGEEDEN